MMKQITAICIRAIIDKKHCSHRYKHSCACSGRYTMAIEILYSLGFSSAQVDKLVQPVSQKETNKL